MKTKNIKVFLILAAVMMLIAQCKEEAIIPLESSTIAPGAVSNVKVVNRNAQALITYTLPSDQDLLYVKAVYLLKSGLQREVKSSYYNNSLIVDGFGDTLPHEVKLYAVNRSELASIPVSVIVTPLRNAIFDVFESLQVIPDFGGVQINANNPARSNVAIALIVKDSLGKWKPFSNIYTAQIQINQTIRGLDTIPMQIGITVRDQFLNYTDTLFKNVTPMFEQALVKSKYRELKLPTDAIQDNENIGLGISRLWDGDFWTWQRMMTKPSDGTQWFSFDLGQSAHLSRIVIWNFSNAYQYTVGNLRLFEIWGSSNPDPNGSFDSWVKLGSYEIIKPSGLPVGQQSSEDYTQAVAGFNFNFKLDLPKVRYLRIKCIKNWAGGTNMDVQEVQLYGDTR